MSPETWARVRALFDEAVELEPGPRSELLTSAARVDGEVAREARELLEAHESSTDLDAADPGLLLDALEECGVEHSLEGQRIGPWQVDRLLDRGGMGDVFLAHRADGAYAETVALKIVRLGMDSPDLVRRFESERQILARLAHPNIARLLDGGVSPDGRPYLVMDYIEGEPITRDAEKRGLSPGQRLALFLEVCDALRYAHQNLVVHRDIKPSNILVTREGRPILLDFGIAKLLDPESGVAPDTALTRNRSRLLTPEYASPEQARGEPVTTASDVYMLGVVLRELLTGTRDAGARRLHGDLEVIVNRATQPEAGRRYGSVDALAEDLRRHLGGLPIHARADAWTYRARKFIGRHRGAVAASLLLLLALVAGAAASLWQAARAERNFADARALANAMVFDVHDAIADLPGSTPARRLLVERALAYLDRLSSRAQHDTSLKIELAKAYIKTANVLGNPSGANLGDRGGALAAFAKAGAVLQTLGPDAESRPAREAAWGLELGLACMDYWASRYDSARVHRARAVTIAESLLTGAANDADGFRRLATIELLGGDIEFWGGTIEDAIGHYRKAVDASEKALAAAPAEPTLRLSLGLSLTQLGEALDWAERYDEADGVLRRAVSMLDDVHRVQPENTRAANSALLGRVRWGELLVERKQLPLALEVLSEATRMGEALLRADPNNAQAQNNLSMANACLGDVQRDLGRYDEALASARAALAIREARRAKDPSLPEFRRAVATSYAQLADIERSRRRYREALGYLGHAIDEVHALRKDAPEDPAIERDLAMWLTSAGLIERGLGEPQAKSHLGEAVALWRSLEDRGQLKPYDRDSATKARAAL